MVQQRKAEKARQLARNKQERQMQREAMQHVNDPSYLRQQLKELLDEEEAAGVLSAAQRSRKKTLQAAYEASIKKQVQNEAEKKRREEGAAGRSGAMLDVSAIPLPSMPPPPGMASVVVDGGATAPPPLKPPPGPPPGPPQKQAYVMRQGGGGTGGVVSGASTVVVRPKAQHDAALKNFVPSSVVRRPVVASKGVVRSRAVTASDAKADDDVPDNLDDFLKSVS